MDEDLILIEDQGFEKFLGIQRELNSGRVAEIQKYVETVDASFPTVVLLVPGLYKKAQATCLGIELPVGIKQFGSILTGVQTRQIAFFLR